MTSWCDKLASTPTIGLKLNFHYSPPDEMLATLAPVIDAASKEDKVAINLNQYDLAAPAVTFTTHGGFKYSLDSTKLSVGFEHILRTRAVSAGPPVTEMLSKPSPYTLLLKEVTARLWDAALLVNAAKPRTITRVGIVSITKVSEDDIPPGIHKLIKYLGRPWRSELESFNYRVIARLADASGYSDRCIYGLDKPDPGSDDAEIMTLNFDWQRVFGSGHAISGTMLGEIVQPAQKAALNHFEELAEGSQFDEDIIRDSIGV